MLQGSAVQKIDENIILNFEKLALRDVFDLQLVIEKDGALEITSGKLDMQEFLKLPQQLPLMVRQLEKGSYQRFLTPFPSSLTYLNIKRGIIIEKLR